MTANANGLHRHYDRLSPEERFRLDVLAMARGDEAESRKLVDTCPRKTYTASDWSFAGRWQGAVELSVFVSLDLSQHLCRLRMIAAFSETLPMLRVSFINEAHAAYMSGHEAGSRYAWKEAGMEGDPPGWMWEEFEDGSVEVDEEREDPKIEEDLDALTSRMEEADLAPPLLKKLERSLVVEALTVWEGYRLFCEEELSLDARKLLYVSFAPITGEGGLDRLDTLKEEHDIAPEETDEKVGEYVAVLSEIWSRQSKEFDRLGKGN